VRRLLSLALAAVLAVGVGTAIVASVRVRVGVGDPPPLTTVRGVIGSELELDGILQAIAKGDADHLLAHGRFLEDRFARSELDIGESGQG
jgi:hypothetical protein